jgi:hypothetical protein
MLSLDSEVTPSTSRLSDRSICICCPLRKEQNESAGALPEFRGVSAPGTLARGLALPVWHCPVRIPTSYSKGKPGKT